MPDWALKRWPQKKGKFVIGRLDAEDRDVEGTYIVGPHNFEWERVFLFAKVEQGWFTPQLSLY